MYQNLVKMDKVVYYVSEGHCKLVESETSEISSVKEIVDIYENDNENAYAGLYVFFRWKNIS